MLTPTGRGPDERQGDNIAGDGRGINWTLSDRRRRIELPVGVSHSAHPKKVMEMLEAVAQAHPQVLRQPAPKAFFKRISN